MKNQILIKVCIFIFLIICAYLHSNIHPSPNYEYNQINIKVNYTYK